MSDLQKFMALEALGKSPEPIISLSNEDILGSLIKKLSVPRRMSTNIEDRRADPQGAQRLETANPTHGDVTFRPPLNTKIIPYNDPEGFMNRERLGKLAPNTDPNPFFSQPITPILGRKR